MLSVRDALFAVDAPPWTLRTSLERPFWPKLAPGPGGKVSARSLATRYSSAGAHLRVVATGGADVWSSLSRTQLVPQLRYRLRDPGIIRQGSSDLCGPVAILVELARRMPAEYVRAVAELLAHGSFTGKGSTVVEAEEELRQVPVPSTMDQADWLLAATIRDDANVHWDVDEGATGAEAMTFWGAMSDWTHNLLGLHNAWETTFNWGELDAIRNAKKAVDAGGVAFLLVDSDLLHTASGEEEEEMWYRYAAHQAGNPVPAFGALNHSKDDNWPPNHWVVFLGDLQLADDDGPISLRVWSWGREYIVSGTADSFTEYLYAVVTGKP